MLDVSGHTKKKRTINMQKQLDNLYQTYLETLFSDKEFEEMIENFRVSSPQFLDTETPRGKYLSSEFKVVFIGKETNGWFNDNERKEEGLTQINRQFEKYIHSLKKIYSRHNIGANYRSPIYLFIDLLVERISESKNVGFLLTELLRHDYDCSGLPTDIIAKVAYDNNFILRKELEILKPDALVFLTGPNYDRHITMTYPTAFFQEFKGYSLNQVSVIKNIPNIKMAIRIYHPDYHNILGADFKYEMTKVIAEFLN